MHFCQLPPLAVLMASSLTSRL